jgi:hypothetical protein
VTAEGEDGAQDFKRKNTMKQIGFLLLAVATLVGIVAYMAHASGQSDGDSSPI